MKWLRRRRRNVLDELHRRGKRRRWGARRMKLDVDKIVEEGYRRQREDEQ